MGFYLRQLDDKICWEWGKETGRYSWLLPDQFPAAPIRDLRPSLRSVISVWYVDANRSNLGRIAAGVAAKRNHLDKFDYALIDEDLLRGAGVKLVKTQGDSSDTQANRDWHWDLIELTLEQLCKLAQLIWQSAERDRFLDAEVGEFIAQGLRVGILSKVDPNILECLPS